MLADIRRETWEVPSADRHHPTGARGSVRATDSLGAIRRLAAMGTQDNLYSVPTAYWDSPQSFVQSFSLCRPPWRLVRKTSNKPSQSTAGKRQN